MAEKSSDMNADLMSRPRPISNGVKNILIFSLAYYPRHVSGAEAAVREITDRIPATDIEFHMVTLRFDPADPREEKIGNVLVHRVGVGPRYLSKMLFIPLSVIKARQLVKAEQIDALWALMTYMLFPVTLLRLTGVRVPHVLTLQDGDPYEKVFGRWFIRPFVPLLDAGMKGAVAIQAISHYLAEWPRRRGYAGPIEVIYNGADPRDIDESVTEEEAAQLAEHLGKQKGDVFITNTARLVHQKGHDTVIRALTLLPREVRFLLVGGGPLKHALERLAEELGVSERVIFAGQVDRMAVSTYRKVADIFVAPSRSEGLGNAFLSAMASRLPVVATREGGLAEFIFDKKHNPDREPTAWVVPKDDHYAVAEAVLAVMNDPEGAKQIAEHARKVVLKDFSWEKIAHGMRTKIFAPALKE